VPVTSTTEKVLYGIIALSLVGIAALLGNLIAQGNDTPSPVVAATAPPVATTHSRQLPAEVAIDVSVRPLTAKIYIDGKLATTNPHHLRTAPSDSNHEIRAEAEGYESRSVILAFDRDRTLDLALVQSTTQRREP
jgi:hypothetical protein